MERRHFVASCAASGLAHRAASVAWPAVAADAGPRPD